MTKSALEQFEITVAQISNYQISLGILALTVTLALLSSIVGQLIYNNENFATIAGGIAGLVKNQQEIPFLVSIFFMILWTNYQGLLSNVYVATTQGFLSISLSIIIVASIVAKALKKKGIRGFGNMFLNDTPLMLFGFIFVIEIFSYGLRALSLGVRLMANLLAGHVLLHTLMTYLKNFLGNKFILPTIGAMIGILGIVLLEQAVWGIQAFVLTLLSATYLNEIED